MASTAPALNSERYFVPPPSYWPFALTVGLATLVIGLAAFFNEKSVVAPFIYGGLAISFYFIFVWFRGIARESETGQYGSQVDRTYRWGMSWFIFSEVMFFAAFFGALYYARAISLPWLSGEGGKASTHLLYPMFEYVWPTNGPNNLGGAFANMDAWGLPFINTCLLLTSGVTITAAHHALKDNKRTACIVWMIATVLLGVVFLVCQAEEYIHAYEHMNLKMTSGIYGSTFFMLTGFHGMHVTLGTLMLLIITIRLALGHFKPESHFGFEGVAWYWHFVDVVWLGLFVFVYIV
jgi:cytochrome c oxidase subunit 3